MANNLHISYDLYVPGQNYENVIERIKSLGAWAAVHKSFWYVNSVYSAEQAAKNVLGAMDVNDRIYVVDATNNSAYWNALPEGNAAYISEQWTR